MNKLSQFIAEAFPNRHRRRWRYISPTRRVSSYILLGILLLIVTASWYFTRSSFVRNQAVSTLEKMTGCNVKIDSASFSFFDGIKITGVKISLKNSSDPFFSADDLKLKYNRFKLWTQLTIQPTEVSCNGFEFVNTRVISQSLNKRETITDTMDQLLKSMNSQGSKGSGADSSRMLPADLVLPRVSMTGGNFKSIIKEKGVETVFYDQQVSCSLEPKDNNIYDLSVTETSPSQQTPQHIAIRIDVPRGTIKPVSGTLMNPLVHFFPGKYYDWIENMGLEGEFYSRDDAPDGTIIYVIQNVHMKIPDEYSGAEVIANSGQLIFKKNSIALDKVKGKLAGIDGSQFEISGNIAGYSADSPLNLRLHFENFQLPADKAFKGDIAEEIRILRENYKPTGCCDLTLTFARDKNKKFSYRGIARPKFMTGTFIDFALPVTNITGEMIFTNVGVEKFDLLAERGKTKFKVTGSLSGYKSKSPIDLTIEGKDVAFEPALRRELISCDSDLEQTWEMIKPQGTIDAKVRMVRRKDKDSMQYIIDAIPNGNTSATYSQFPYKLTNMTGLVTLRDDVIKFHQLEAKSNNATFNITGEISKIYDSPKIEFSVAGTNISINKKMLDALPAVAKNKINRLGASGKISVASGKITKLPNKKLDYNFDVTVANVSIYDKDYPYEISSGVGQVKISSSEIVLNSFSGKHKKSSVKISGKLDISGQKELYNFKIKGDNIVIDSDLKKTLNKKSISAYEDFSPEGVADISAVFSNTKTNPNKRNFKIKVKPKSIRITPKEFPYSLNITGGQVTITPDKVNVSSLIFTRNKMRGKLEGNVLIQPQKVIGELDISFSDLSIDKTFLKAMPKSWKQLSHKFSPGGTCTVKSGKLVFVESIDKKKKASNFDWKLSGKTIFTDAKIDVGLGQQPISGSFDGSINSQQGALVIKSKFKLSQAKLGKYAVTDLAGNLSKDLDSSVLHFTDLLGKTYGGKLAGQGSVRLEKDPKYSLKLEFQNVDLAKFVNVGIDDKKKISQVTGKLGGKISISGKQGKNSTKQAVGDLLISKAKIYKLPVILDFLNVLYLTIPGDAAFNKGAISYHLKNEKLYFKEIHLTGKTISVLGAGSMNTENGKLDLTFLTGKSGQLPRMKNISDEILRAILKEIVEIKVTGTVKKPKMETLNLRSIRMLMDRLIIKMPE